MNTHVNPVFQGIFSSIGLDVEETPLTHLGLTPKFNNPQDLDLFEATFLELCEQNPNVFSVKPIEHGYVMHVKTGNRIFYITYYPIADKVLDHFNNRHYMNGMEWLTKKLDL